MKMQVSCSPTARWTMPATTDESTPPLKAQTTFPSPTCSWTARTALVKTDSSGTRFEDVRVALGGVGPVPERLGDVEERLIGKAIDSGLIADVAEATAERVASRSRIEYRRHVVPGFVRAALEEAVQRARLAPVAGREAVHA